MIRGNCIRIGGGTDDETAFIERTLTSIENNTVTKITGNLFQGCNSLEQAAFEGATEVSGCAFYGCSSLRSVSIPNVTKIGTSAFYGNTQLTEITLPAVTFLGYFAFQDCAQLVAVYLPSDTICEMQGTGWVDNAFNSTPIYGGIGRVYVPSALYNDYKSAPGWSRISNSIVSYSFGGAT